MSKGQTAAVVLGAALLCIISGLIGATISSSFDVSWGSQTQVDFAQAISIILSALGALLTTLALLFSILAVVGWATFSQQVDRNVRSYIETDFDKKGPLFESVTSDLKPKLKEELLPELERAMYRGTEPDEEDMARLDADQDGSNGDE
jgi:hypothetical protein